ncbi:MAG: hypothetical protein O3A46_08345, partial [Candidatus Poribacteria bacterium]|nr:hypothetical protein [Candidatus Poribacteria bacterium]
LKWDKRVFAMAGGAGFRHPHIGVEEYVEYCLNSRTTERVIRQRVPACVCITVRDPYAHALLNALEIENAYLPCTATWASRMWNVSPSEERPYLLLVPPPPRYVVGQPSRSERRAAFARQWKALYDALKESGENVRVLCHELAEYDALLRAIPPDDLWFHGDSFTLLRQYASAHTVVSGRLHGSLPAYGIAGTRVVNVSVDVRGSAVEKFPKIENVSLDDATPETVLAALAALEPSDPTDLLPFENDTIDLIRRSVRDLSLN